MKWLVAVVVFSFELSSIASECTDIYGNPVTQNAHFIPGPDVCQLCVCDNTSAKWCKRVLCSPPMNCKSFVMGSSCCDYSCLDNSLPSVELRDEIDRRFLITIVTAFFILTVLLIVIHKLRHRAINGRLQNRPLPEDRRAIGFITGSLGYLNLPPNVHHFDDHPIVHFPIYKPNGYYSRSEAPPPYDEAVADVRLSSYAHYEMITNERNMSHINHHRRRNPLPFEPRIIDQNGNCLSEPRPGENGIFVDETAVSDGYGNLPQHRTIPLPLCLNSDQINRPAADNTLLNVGPSNRVCSIYKQNNDFDYQRARANSTNQKRSSNSGNRLNTCPPQFHLTVASLGDAVTGTTPQHRPLPLSASLSSPLPSASDRQSQFPDKVLGPTSSSPANLCSLNSNERTPSAVLALPPIAGMVPVPVPSTSKRHHHHHHHHHKTCKKALQASITTAGGETSHEIVKCSRERRSSVKGSSSKESPIYNSSISNISNNDNNNNCNTNNSNNNNDNNNTNSSCNNNNDNNNNNNSNSIGSEMKEENQEGNLMVDDYYAECENCNLNVGEDACDGSDEYFSKQETMTLQRKLHEISVVQVLDNKVSLTLPTNSSRSHRRCSSKNRKCGGWHAKESPLKTTLEYVSSEVESDDEVIDETTKNVKDTIQSKCQELSSVVEPKNANIGTTN